MGHRQSRARLLDDDGPKRSYQTIEDDPQTEIPDYLLEDGFLHEGARRGLVPNETLQTYIDRLYQTYPSHEIRRLATESPPEPPVHVNPVVAALAVICIKGLADGKISNTNLDLVFERFDEEIYDDPPCVSQALIACIDIGMAMMRYPGTHNEDPDLVWDALGCGLSASPDVEVDPATEKRLAWLKEVVEKIEARVIVMNSWDSASGSQTPSSPEPDSD